MYVGLRRREEWEPMGITHGFVRGGRAGIQILNVLDGDPELSVEGADVEFF